MKCAAQMNCFKMRGKGKDSLVRAVMCKYYTASNAYI